MKPEIENCHKMLGLRIKMIRETLGVEQTFLAKRIGITRASLANMEAGRQRFLLQMVEKVANGLGTTPKALMKGIWW